MRIGLVAAQLDVSPSTLQRWTERFADCFSDGAARPPSNGHGRAVARDYNESDILLLRAVQTLRGRNLSDEAIAVELRAILALKAQGRSEEAIWAERHLDQEAPVVADENGNGNLIVHIEQSSDLAQINPQAAVAALAVALRQISDGQQALLNSQQANRDLLNVVVQDNFNLKEENLRLRKQLRQVEQDLSHLKESDWNQRLSLEERMTALEQHGKKSWWQRLLRL
jgi:DNA-binding transcriptional MerR regulator